MDLEESNGNREQFTVKLKKASKGFGFTLAGQYPCILSNVQSGGVAYSAGLRGGDSLLFISDRPVAHMEHSSIAQLLASAGPVLNVTVARAVNGSSKKKISGSLKKVHKSSCDGNVHHADCMHDGDTSADSDSQVWQQQRLGAEHRLMQGVQAGGSLRKQNKMPLGSALSTGTSNLHKRRSGSIEGLLSSNSASSRRKSTGSKFMSGFMSHRNSHKFDLDTILSPDRPGPFTCAGVLAAANNIDTHEENNMNDIHESSNSLQKKSSKKDKQKLNSLFFGHDDSFDELKGKGKKQKKESKKSSQSSSPSNLNRLHRSCSQPEGLQDSVNSMRIAQYSSDSEEEDGIIEPSHSTDTSLKRERRKSSSKRLVMDLMGDQCIFQCVLVYIGAVPVPHLNLSHRHIVRSALLSLQTQKAKARTVLFQIFSHQIVVTNSRCAVTHRMRTSCIVFTTPCAESTQYFGICTVHSPQDHNKNKDESSSPDSPPSAVCHMFAADPELHLHSFHYHYARKFGVQCSRDPESGFCLEFPYVSGPVLHAIAYARKSYQVMNDANIKEQDASPPPVSSSSSSTTINRRRGYASSNNSDSGIGEACPQIEAAPSCLIGRSQVQRSKSYTKDNKLRVTFEEPVLDSEPEPCTPPSTPSPGEMQSSSPESVPPPLPPKLYLQQAPTGKPEPENDALSSSLLKDVLEEIETKEHQRKVGSSENCSMKMHEGGTPNTYQIIETNPHRLQRSWSTDLLHARSDSGVGESADLMDFDNMLHDHNARQAFQTFLQHQFCGENMTFWVGVEQYKKGSDKQREKLGSEIYEKHFCCGCSEPVNVDCAVMQKIKEAVGHKRFTNDLFDMAQHQIFHLMKYDCWPRFLKSDLASGAEKFCGSKQSTGAAAMDKSRDQKRRSLLPGGMKQKLAVFRGEKKKKEEKTSTGVSSSGQKKQQSWRKNKQNSMPSQLAHSTQPSTSQNARPDVVPEHEPRTGPSPVPATLHGSGSTCSAPSSSRIANRVESPEEAIDELLDDTSPNADAYDTIDLTNACVVILPSGESVALPVIEDVSVRHWLHSVAIENGVNPAAAELYDVLTGDQCDATASAHVLRGKQTRLEAAVLFKVDLPMIAKDAQGSHDKPMRKLVAVRARPESAAGLVLRPVLSRYGLELDKLVVCMCDSTEVLPNAAPIKRADGRKLVVLTNKEFQEWVHSDHGESSCPSTPRGDDTTKPMDISSSTSYNQPEPHHNSGSSALSGMLKFVRSSKNGGQRSNKNGGSPPSRLTTTSASFHGQLLQRKSLGGMGSFGSGRSSSTPSADKRLTLSNPQEFREIIMKEHALADLVEKAQCQRLDDQRAGSFKGQFELPDFLKRSSRSSSIPGSEEVFVPATDFFRATGSGSRTDRPEHRCVVAVDPPHRCPPSPREIQVVYDSNISGNDSSSNVSIVTVGEVPSMETTQESKKGRPPPPPYPGGPHGKAQSEPPAVPVKSQAPLPPRPKPIYVPTAGEATELGGWKVDYV